MKDYAEVIFLLDKSGSMDVVRDDTIGGVNTFIRKQKEDKDGTIFSFYQFSNSLEYSTVGQKMEAVKELTSKTYIPNGGTALLDAIGTVIEDTGKRFKDMKEEERPSKVIFVIQTDGEENSSRKYTFTQVKDMIEHQELKYNWKFIFLGAGLDACSQASALGVCSTNSMNYSNNSRGIDAVYLSVTESLTSMKRMDNTAYTNASAFTQEDYKKQEDAKNAGTK